MALNQPFLAMAQQLLSQMSSDSPNQPGNINALMQLHLATQLASNVRQGSTDETTTSELDSDEIKSELDSSEQSKTDGENNMDEDRGDDMSSLILNNTLAGISSGQRVFQCELCDKAFTQAGNLKRHMRNVHEGRKDFECGECGKKFKQLQSLKVHKKCVHLGLREFACELCGKQCSTKSSLKSHIINNHSVEPVTKKNTKVKCPLCSNVFCHSGSLKRHMRTVHEGRSDFVCDQCNKRFKSYQSMKIHKKCVHEGRRDFTCGECGRQLCTKSSLRTHIRNSHPSHDLAEVEARSIIAPGGSSGVGAEEETLPSLNVAQNLLSILGMANNEEESDDDEDGEMVVEAKDDSVMEVRNISTGPEGEENPYVMIPLNLVKSLPTNEILRQLNRFKELDD